MTAADGGIRADRAEPVEAIPEARQTAAERQAESARAAPKSVAAPCVPAPSSR